MNESNTANPSKRTFLVPVDFGEQSLIALEQSYNLARLYNADIVLLFVREVNPVSRFFKKNQSEFELMRRINDRLDRLARRSMEDAKVNVIHKMSKGKVHERIVELAEEMNTDLIIMGGGDDISLPVVFSSTNAMKVVKTAPCPVITVRGKRHNKGCKRIVLPLDLTKETTQKVEKAIELARLFNGSEINVISVLYFSEKEKEEAVIPLINKVEEHISNHGIGCKAEVVKIVKGEDSYATGILGYADWVKADLIMIMTQQEEEGTSLFVGSSAQIIINESEIPVMSVVPGS